MASRRTASLLALLGLLLAGLVVVVVRTLGEQSEVVHATAPAARGVQRERPPVGSSPDTPMAPAASVAPTAAPAAPQGTPLAPARAAGSQLDRSAALDPELAEAWWVEGRLSFPLDTPRDERVEIEADGRDFEHRPHHRVEVGPDGSFRVAFAAKTRKGKLRVHARHLYDPDPRSIDVREVEGELPTIELALGGRIEGVVVPPGDVTEEERAGLVGTRLQVAGPNAPPAALDEDLRFELDALKPGAYTLTLDSERFQDVELAALQVEPVETLEVELAPRRGVRLAGVVRVEGGAPPDGGHLSISSEDEGHHTWTNESLSADGRFDLHGVTPGEITLRVSAAGALDGTLELGLLEDGAVREDIDFALERGAAVSGVVSWADGRPAEGVSVQVTVDEEHSSWNWMGHGKVETDAEGHFEVTGLPEGDYEVTARGQPEVAPRREDESLIDHRRRQRDAAYLTAMHSGRAPQSGLSLVLRSGLALAGRVADDRGAPIEDFRVSARPYSESPFGSGRSVSKHVRASDGGFELEGLEAGVWVVAASARGHLRAEDRIVQVPPDVPLRLELAREPQVSGRVVGPDGEPPGERASVVLDPLVELERPGIHVDFDGHETRTLAERDGGFEVKGLVGACLLVASADGFADSEPVQVVLEPGAARSDVVLRLRRGGRIEGRLEADQVGHVRIRARSSAERFQFDAPETRTDASGAFRFEGLTPDEYVVSRIDESSTGAVSFGAYGYDSAELGGVVVRVEDGVTARVVLDATGSRVLVVGRVVRDGAPLDGVSVWGHSVAQNAYVNHDGPTGADGRFELTVARPGDYQLFFSHEAGGGGVSRRVSIPSGERHELEIDLGGASMTGRVLADGKAVSGANVSLAPEGSDPSGPIDRAGLWTETGADGRFELSPIEDGRYDLEVAHESYAPLKREGIVVVGGKTPGELELHLERGGTLTGTVRHASGDLAPEAPVYVRRQGTDLAGVLVREQADEGGAFRLEPVPSGRLVVVARQGNAWGQSRPVEVTPGDEASVEVVLEPGTVLGVTALDAGHPVPAASVSVIDTSGLDHASLNHRFGSGASFAGATHTVGPLPPGRYRVRATFADGEVVERELTVDGESARSLELAHP